MPSSCISSLPEGTRWLPEDNRTPHHHRHALRMVADWSPDAGPSGSETYANHVRFYHAAKLDPCAENLRPLYRRGPVHQMLWPMVAMSEPLYNLTTAPTENFQMHTRNLWRPPGGRVLRFRTVGREPAIVDNLTRGAPQPDSHPEHPKTGRGSVFPLCRPARLAEAGLPRACPHCIPAT